MTTVLFCEVLLAWSILRNFGQLTPNVLFVAAAFVGSLFFFVPLSLRRTPTTTEQIARSNRWTCLWVLVYLGALFWLGKGDDFSL
jgi:hypothetical protein